jgi:ATP-dependent exoDNAse (exonuclease V) alpha subunit
MMPAFNTNDGAHDSSHDGAHDGERALATIRSDHPIVMVVGRAGTGKSTLIRTLMEQDADNQVVVAPTGVAALNVGGQTIHSFFRIPPRLNNLDEIQPRPGGAKLFKSLKRVIIDEISMVRADLLDAVDYALQINRRNSRPFGGVQMVLVGDFLQLPPVVRGDEVAMLARMGYETPFAFSAKCLRDNPVTKIELAKIYRQDDPEFIRLLGNLRSGHELTTTIAAFNQACFGKHQQHANPVILAGTNAVADRYNRDGMNSLPDQAVAYTGAVEGDFKLDKDKLPAPEHLELKVGARIMMAKNDKDKNWVNGSLGTVMRLGKDRIWVKLDDKVGEYEVTKTSWENIRYGWDEDSGSVQAKTVGSYSQLPVILAWALTIHKAQGLTLDNVRVDLATGAFASGQAYVALSRARSLAGLSFATPLRNADIIVDPALLPRTALLG